MSDTTFVFFCQVCSVVTEIESVPFEDGSGGIRRCATCKTEMGFWVNGGTLDLEALRFEKPADSERFQVFP